METLLCDGRSSAHGLEQECGPGQLIKKGLQTIATIVSQPNQLADWSMAGVLKCLTGALLYAPALQRGSS